MSLSYAELWFLEVCVNLRGSSIGFCCLHDSDEDRKCGISALYNLAVNGLSAKQIGETLWMLFRSDDIQFQEQESVLAAPKLPFVPESSEQVTALISPWCKSSRKSRSRRVSRFCYSYSITESGVARWEEYARPNWGRYRTGITSDKLDSGDFLWSVISSIESFARELLEFDASKYPVSDVIHWDTTEFESLVPWKPIPQKTLPAAVKLSVRVTKSEPALRSNDQDDFLSWIEWMKKYDQWFREICRWYDNGVMNHPDRPLLTNE